MLFALQHTGRAGARGADRPARDGVVNGPGRFRRGFEMRVLVTWGSKWLQARCLTPYPGFARLLGETILATDMWHSTAAFVGGLLGQSAAVLVSVVMLRTRVFSRTTSS
jgi:hypothetical protein